MPRSHERVAFLTEIILDFVSGRREARISDLSQGGCYVECFVTTKVGDVVRFELQLPGGESLPAEGEVTYVFEGMGFGLKFLDLSEPAQQRINQLIAQATP